MRTRTRGWALALALLTPALLTGTAVTQAAPPPPGASPPLAKFQHDLEPIPVIDARGTPGAAPVRVALDEVLARHTFHPALPPTPTFAYTPPGAGNTFLGPTIEVQKDAPVALTVRNMLGDGTQVVHPFAPDFFDNSLHGAQQELEQKAVPTAVHLHGGHTPPDSDGGPDDTFYPVLDPSIASTATKAVNDVSTGPEQIPGQYTYTYPNDQEAAGLWIHDHALGATRLNPKSGLAANYLIRDQFDTGRAGNALGLPTGVYERPLVLQDGQFRADGTFSYPVAAPGAVHPVWAPESFGDVAIVNGKAWPNLNVDRATYRFRVVNGSNARVYRLGLVDAKDRPARSVPVFQIGSDGGLLNTPVPLTNSALVLAPGERADLLVDFSKAAPGAYRWTNNAPTPFPNGPRAVKKGGAPLKDIMQFTVGSPSGTVTAVPATLRGGPGQPPVIPAPAPPAPADKDFGPSRTMMLNEILDAAGVPVEVLINNQRFHDAHGPTIAANPSLNTSEVWTLVNTTADTHPIHLHLTQFRVLNRQAFNSAGYLTEVSANIRAKNPTAAALPDPSAGGLGTGTTRSFYGEELVVPPDATPFLRGAPKAPAPGERGWKDTVMSNPGEVLRILVPFGGTKAGITSAFDGDDPTAAPAEQRFVGNYVWHCHILEHEENDMMLSYKVVDRRPQQ
jgi:spore coat protein A, manganese oxidase